MLKVVLFWAIILMEDYLCAWCFPRRAGPVGPDDPTNLQSRSMVGKGQKGVIASQCANAMPVSCRVAIEPIFKHTDADGRTLAVNATVST
jgi:hypothetical protein